MRKWKWTSLYKGWSAIKKKTRKNINYTQGWVSYNIVLSTIPGRCVIQWEQIYLSIMRSLWNENELWLKFDHTIYKQEIN